MKIKCIGFFLVFLFTASQAYPSVLDTGDILKQKTYRVTVVPQFLFTENVGVNLGSRIDFGLNKVSELGALVGFGASGFQLGSYYKLVPFPDLDSQPAVGLKVGFDYARKNSTNSLALRAIPLLSKKFKTNFADFNVFSSLPISFHTSDVSDGSWSIQLVGGTEINFPQLEFMNFAAEIGLLSGGTQSSYISFALVLYADQLQNIQFR